MMVLHDERLASPDDDVRDEAVSRIVDRYQGDVLFCDDPDCTLYVTSPYLDNDGTLQRVSERGLLCVQHR
jgi:hypothetical protein